ncbi:hypothetical protein BCR34DRAFT_568642 [Clohesyomyces aquaticus]|uniref:Uncharacterized protein n=1 Tax=Clohesyomyces aquaticus TaxID=1231657 RepID=A0A1Y1ZGA2_9PLEO|nr:hypothetical protein BCR34DRAFT_568642 [Clohesyomyces aquaticus]
MGHRPTLRPPPYLHAHLPAFLPRADGARRLDTADRPIAFPQSASLTRKWLRVPSRQAPVEKLRS